jgi:hypothetical protein
MEEFRNSFAHVVQKHKVDSDDHRYVGAMIRSETVRSSQ